MIQKVITEEELEKLLKEIKSEIDIKEDLITGTITIKSKDLFIIGGAGFRDEFYNKVKELVNEQNKKILE